ncbi:hypothetical protein [Flagellimonas olearia]|uniref:EF-hand domain-containing protein n=1 Tax=Flagellimonas olearia TaxID=552546 RepID=A0A444VP49_9FLAO|nr:hypothetical protein [Allomuricauda olearia]RYC52587.1 hypothetical protein DN53_07615 [Allomuricauda olearia]
MSYNQIGILLGICAVLIILLTWKKIHNPYLKSLWKSGLLLFSLYATLLVLIEIRWHFISEFTSKFDTNGNGFVDLSEYSEEAIEAMNRRAYVANVRNYAPLTLAALSSIIGFSYLVSDVMVLRLQNKEFTK